MTRLFIAGVAGVSQHKTWRPSAASGTSQPGKPFRCRAARTRRAMSPTRGLAMPLITMPVSERRHRHRHRHRQRQRRQRQRQPRKCRKLTKIKMRKTRKIHSLSPLETESAWPLMIQLVTNITKIIHHILRARRLGLHAPFSVLERHSH